MGKNRDFYDPSVFVAWICAGVSFPQSMSKRENMSVDED